MRHVFIVVLSVMLIGSLTATAASAQEIPELAIESYRLDNGLKVALSHDPLAPRTTVCVAYHVGSKNEREGLTGFAHFFEHMMFRGTLNVPNFDVPLQPAGGSPNAFTSNDMTVYFETVSNDYIERTLFMEAERMAFLSSGLSPQKFDTEREIVKNERRQRMENQPYGLASEAIQASLFGDGHPYSWSVIGSMRDLNNASLGDLREFFFEYYHPGNATLTVVGSFDVDSTKKWIDDYFGILRTGVEIPTVDIPQTEIATDRFVQLDQVRFPRVYWNYRAVSESHEDAVALDVLAAILGDGDASRLHQDLVVEHQLASDAGANTNLMEIDGMFSIDATAAAGVDLSAIEERLREVIDRLIDEGPTNEELERVQITQTTRLLNGLTSTRGRAITIGMGFSQYGDPHYYQEQFRRLNQTTVADVQRVSRDYLGAEKFVLEVRPVPEGGEESEAILAGPRIARGTAADTNRRQPADQDTWTALPGPATAPVFEPPMFSRHRLDNGIEVYLANWKTLPLTSVRLLVPFGRVDDPAGKQGLSRLALRLWDKGTAERTPTEFAEALSALGTSLSVRQSFDVTQLGYSVTTSQLAPVTNLVTEMLTQPRFDPDAFELERGLMLNDLAQGPSNPSWIAGRVFDRLVFGSDNPLGLPSAGFTETVSSLSLEDVRNYYQRHVTPTQAKLIVVTSAPEDEVITLLEETLGSWKGQEVSRAANSAEGTAPTQVVYAVDKPDAVQSVIMVGRPWRARDAESSVVQDVAESIFSNDFLSRVNQNLRERNGYTYGARSASSYFQGGSRWQISTSIRADVTAAGLREILNEIELVRGDKPIDAEELMVARDSSKNQFPDRFGTPDAIASTVSDMAAYGLPEDWFAQYLPRLSRVTVNEANALLKEMTDPNQLVILVVGDRKLLESQFRAHGFERVRWLDVDGNPVDTR